jgi:hypothetical protein
MRRASGDMKNRFPRYLAAIAAAALPVCGW